MVHLLSSRYRREFAGLIEGVRFGLAADRDLPSPAPLTAVLLIKATTHTLKYLIRLRTFRLLFWKSETSGHLWYGVQIADDPAHPGTLWSIAESEEELTAVSRLLETADLSVFLFNEEGLNVASASIRVRFAEPERIGMIVDAKPAPDGASKLSHGLIDSLLAPGSSVKLLEADPTGSCEWIEVQSTLITQRLTHCELSMITGEEGDQQELLAEWLVDALRGPVAVRNPLVYEQQEPRTRVQNRFLQSEIK